MNCPNCNKPAAPGTKFCAACGAPIPQQTDPVQQPPVNNDPVPRPAGKGPSRRPILIGALSAVAVVLVAVLVFLWMGRNSTPEQKVEKSIQKSSQAMEKQMDQMENFSGMSDTLKEVNEKNAFTLTMSYGQKVESDWYTSDNSIEYIANYSGKNESMDLTANINMDGEELVLKGYLDRKSMQFGLPDLLDDIYGFPLENLTDTLENSYLGEFLADELDLDLADLLTDDALFTAQTDPELQEKLDVFSASIAAEPREKKETLELDQNRECTAYEITFGQQELEDLLEIVLDPDQNPYMTMFVEYGMDTLDVDEIMDVVEEMELTVYVDDRGYFVGGDLEYDGEALCLRLTGADNPWEEIHFYPEGYEDEALIITLDVDDGSLDLKVKMDGETLLRLKYDDANGEISLEAEGEEITAGLKLKLVRDGETAAISLEYEESFDGFSSSMSFYIGIASLASEPQPLSDDYVNILEMDEEDFEALGREIEEAFMGTSGSFGETVPVETTADESFGTGTAIP